MPVTPGREGVRQEMRKFKAGTLHSGSKTGPTVTNPKQAIAIALHEAGMSKRDDGGAVDRLEDRYSENIEDRRQEPFAPRLYQRPNFPELNQRALIAGIRQGGTKLTVPLASSAARWKTRDPMAQSLGYNDMKNRGGHVSPKTGYRGGFQPMLKGGFIATDVPGRTDKHYVTVKEGSYVLPADHVGQLGEGNSLAGAKVVKQMFGPGGKWGPRVVTPRFAGGGGVKTGVPVVVAGGEIVIPPEAVKRVGGGSLEKGHSILDRWVLSDRKKHIKKLKSLKPPKGANEK